MDYGFGPGVRPDRNRKAVQEMMAAPSAAAAPVAGADAQITGVFGAPVTWPLIGLHVVLLPDGRVMSYGSTAQGKAGGQIIYDVWDPDARDGHRGALGAAEYDGNEHLLQRAIRHLGERGGSRRRRDHDDQRRAELLHPANDDLPSSDRSYPGFHQRSRNDGVPAVVSLGRFATHRRQADPRRPQDQAPDVAVPTPEVYRQGTGWRTLWGATSDAAFGTVAYNWYYPRAFVTPGGRVFVLGHSGETFYLDPAGNGKITQLAQTTLAGDGKLPSLMYAPGKILSVRNQQKVIVVDVNGAQPVVGTSQNIDQVRLYSNATVLADGKVLVTGGSAVANQLTGVAYAAMIWDPATGQWTSGASAVKPRLYHSIALLLPDGSVLTGAGGAPGPVNNLNMEIYYPPYLFDASGQPAARPSIVDSNNPLTVNQQFVVTMGSADPIGRVTLVRTGSATHAFNPDQRFLQFLPGSGFTQTGQILAVQLPANVNVLIPGYYLLFVFNQAGVPSVAKIVHVG